MTWPPETILYASDDTPAAVEEAKQYIRANGYTKEQVRLVQRSGQTLVIWRG